MADKRRKAKADPTEHVVAKTFAVSLALTLVLGILSFVQVADIERGILEVCATQQDGYVQLVLDQINLKENRDDEEIIADILSTMDASTTKYWVFSQDQTMLFVKDVTETNKYKGFSAASYWGAQDAAAFLDSLEQGAVVHGYVTVGDVEYLASGSVFAYDGRDYRLCLLTNRAALLDNNDYLGARSRLLVLMLAALGLMLILPVAVALRTAAARRQAAAEHDEASAIDRRLHELAEDAARREAFDPRLHVWSEEALDRFLEKLIARKAEHARLALVEFDDGDAKTAFLERASLLLGEGVARFSMGEGIALLFVDADPEQVRSEVGPLLDDSARLVEVLSVMEQTDARDQP